MRKSFLGAVGAVVGAVLVATTNPVAAATDCGDVTITEMNWASGTIVTAISKFLMEQGYGCAVTKVPTGTVPAMTSVAETGRPDILTELWLNSAPTYPDLEAAGKVVTLNKVLSDGGVEGWWIPKYLAEKHPGLTKIDGVLAHPDWVGGKFHNCPDGWGCRLANDNLKVAFDLEGHGLEVFNHGSGETLGASIASAYEDGKPWFGYYWAPTPVLGKYAMVKVDMGPHVAEVHACNQKKECATPGKSAYPTAAVLTAVTKTFAEKNPEVTELMRRVSFTNAQMGETLAWQQANKASPEEAAVHFLTTYKDVWSKWLSAEAKTKLANFLN